MGCRRVLEGIFQFIFLFVCDRITAIPRITLVIRSSRIRVIRIRVIRGLNQCRPARMRSTIFSPITLKNNNKQQKSATDQVQEVKKISKQGGCVCVRSLQSHSAMSLTVNALIPNKK